MENTDTNYISEGINRIVALIKVFYDAAVAVGFNEDQAMQIALNQSEQVTAFAARQSKDEQI